MLLLLLRRPRSVKCVQVIVDLQQYNRPNYGSVTLISWQQYGPLVMRTKSINATVFMNIHTNVWTSL